MNRKNKPFDMQMIEIPRHKTPEQELWCMVLDRALTDYAFFYDWLITLDRDSVSDNADQTANMTRELRTLEWFLFAKESVPHNLNWIIDYCYDGDDLLGRTIKKKVAEKHRINLARHQNHAAVKPFVKEFLEHSELPELAELPPVKRPRLRMKLLLH